MARARSGSRNSFLMATADGESCLILEISPLTNRWGLASTVYFLDRRNPTSFAKPQTDDHQVWSATTCLHKARGLLPVRQCDSICSRVFPLVSGTSR